MIVKDLDSVHTFFINCHIASVNAGWWNDPDTGRELLDNPYTVPTKLMLAVSELAEGMEGYRKGLRDDHLPHRDMLEVELADAVIRIADLAGALGYDLATTIQEKLDYNAQREDHKIGNRTQVNGKKF